MDRVKEKSTTFAEVIAELLADYESAKENSVTTLKLFRDEKRQPSGYQIEGSRKEMVKITLK